MRKTYVVEVRGFDRLSVLDVVAESEEEALELALERRNIRAKIVGERPADPAAPIGAHPIGEVLRGRKSE